MFLHRPSRTPSPPSPGRLRLARGPALASATFVAASLTATAPAFAQQPGGPFFTYAHVPLGGRTATMGGAGAAFGKDSAMPLLNPAGLAQVDEHTVSISATAYEMHAVDVESYHTSGGTSSVFQGVTVRKIADSFRSQTTSAYPTSFTYSWPFGDDVGNAGHHVVSLSILVPRRYNVEYDGFAALDMAGIRAQAITAKASTLTGYYLGPTYAVQLTEAIRLGAGLMAVYHEMFSTANTSSWVRYGADSWRTENQSTTDAFAWSVVPVAGIQVQAAEDLHLGASVHAPTYHLVGHAESSMLNADSASLGIVLDGLAASSASVRTERLVTDDYRIDLPAQVTAGVGYQVEGDWALAADVHYHFPLKFTYVKGTRRGTATDEGLGTQTYEYDQKVVFDNQQVINVNVGVEVFLTEGVALRAGGFTDRSAAPEPRVGGGETQLYTRHVDLYGGSLGLGFVFGAADFTVGAVYMGGTGKMGVPPGLLAGTPQDVGPYQVADVTESRVFGILTGGVRFGEAFAPVSEELRQFDTPEEVWRNPGEVVPGTPPPGAQPTPVPSAPIANPPGAAVPPAPPAAPAPRAVPAAPPPAPPPAPAPQPEPTPPR